MADTGAASASRTRRILEPSFVEDLSSLPVEEVRRRRDEVLAVREYQSYLRRLLQVRTDLLRAERDRRASGGAAEPLVERITSVLAEGPQGRGRGEALRTKPSEADMSEAERRADEAMGGPFQSSLDDLDDEALRRALEGLEREEGAVSRDRGEVFRVHDLLQAELKRRYREDPSQIPAI